jgi:hypothetical protein
MAKIVLTDQHHAFLNRLAEEARAAKEALKIARQKRKKSKAEWDEWFDIQKKQTEAAIERHRSAYRQLGITTKQAELQREWTSKGLCRQCGKKAESGTYCDRCRKISSERSKARRRKKN